MWRIGMMVMLASAWLNAEVWTVVTADFAKASGTLQRLNDEGIVLRQREAAREIPWRDIVLLRQEGGTAPAEEERYVLMLRNGQRIAGEPAAMDAETITWRGRAGDMKFALEAVRGWTRPGRELPATADEDVVILANGDELRGIVDAGEGGLLVQQGTNQATIPWANLRSVSLAEIGAAPEAVGTLFVRLADGSAMLAERLEQRGEMLALHSGGGEPLNVTIDNVSFIENRGGRAQLLAWQTPASSRYVPYMLLAETPPDALRVQNEVIIGGRMYLNVLELRPRTALTYTAPAAGHLHLQYAAANPGVLTDMVLRIRVGERIVHEAEGVSSPRPSEALRIDVNRGETVAIEVDYGENFDADDLLWLLDAAFIAAP